MDADPCLGLLGSEPYRRLPTGTKVYFHMCVTALQLLLLVGGSRACSLPFSLAARWRPPPRLRHRGDRLHRSRHVKARLLTCGTLRCVRPCARTLILAGPANASPACCERQAGSAGAHECSEMYRGRQGLITSSGEPCEQLRRSLSVTQDAPKLLPFALGRCSADVPILEELQRQRLRSVFEP